MKGPRSDNALHPSNWGQTTAIAALRLIAHLPWRWALGLGERLGGALYHVAKSRRYIVRRNLELCFPDLTETQREEWVRANFRYTGRGVAEVALAWFGGKAVDRIPCRIDGLHHLRAAAEEGSPVILLSGHFTSVEIAGRLFGQRAEMAVIYKPMNKKPLLERAMKQGRERSLSRAVSKDDIRGILRTLKAGVPVWYAGDQNIRQAELVFAPFFGQPAATTTGLSRLASMARARVLPLFYHVDAHDEGYEIVIGPPLENYPSGDRAADAARMNQVLEEAVRAYPQQYFWAHRRFKTQPDGSADPYPGIRSKHIGRLPWQQNKLKKKNKRKTPGDGA